MNETKALIGDYKKFEDMFLKLKGGLRFSRLGKPFETNNNKYFLDSGTGKIFEVNDNVYSVLECLWNTDNFNELFELGMSDKDLLSALNEVEEVVQSENILQMQPIKTMHFNNVDINNYKIEDTQMKNLSIEMTERCNLRCKYCVYHEDQGGFRTFGKKDITFDVIKKAIDLLALSTEDEAFISFYGGEPLLKFDLIKQSIDYCNKKLSNKKLHYNMTTNATLITEEIASYLSSLENYFTTISLDGPELIHNKNRVFADETGSFEKTMKGLSNLVKAEGENASKRIHFNIVLDDTSKETFEKIQDFYNVSEWIPNGSNITTSYITTGNKEFEYLGVGTEEEKKVAKSVEKESNPLSDWNIEKINSGESAIDKNPLISKDFIDKGLHAIHKRMLIDQPAKVHYMNGCCIPSARKLYLTVDGNFSVCERIGPSPFIGNVDEGINFDKIRKYYIEDFTNEASKYCNDCWAVHICSLCYMNCYDEDGIHISYRHAHCLGHRQEIESNLVRYHEILENNPKSLAYLNDIVVS
ncbi:radical SAM protein (plasmid) [Paraclostridium ghonii]|uniref:radical SAM protein n=1 Tax=Paraclostridium ghonii TaxID=29358 RepID=UPI00202D09F5|nr:radical SAM protein [Paeniclostridium ghonii]MCM0167180.1 radical SAM protein [Paeniclostridium ghonii]